MIGFASRELGFLFFFLVKKKSILIIFTILQTRADDHSRKVYNTFYNRISYYYGSISVTQLVMITWLIYMNN